MIFSGALKDTPPQIILTHELVDRIYPVKPVEGTEIVAKVQGRIVGVVRSMPAGGTAAFLGFRPRDDQSCSFGYDVRTWFDVLNALGAYPPSGKYPGENDNTEVLSRTGEYLACRFPNGTITIARHVRLLEEGWPGGFARNKDEDKAYLAAHPALPTDKIELRDFKVNGHCVTYDGTGVVAFRLDQQGRLIAFSGMNCRGITLDGRTTRFADQPVPLVEFAPIHPSRRVPGGAIASAKLNGAAVRLPAERLPEKVKLFAQANTPGSKGEEIQCRREGDSLLVDVPPSAAGRDLWIVADEP